MQGILHCLQLVRRMVQGLDPRVRVLADGVFSDFNVLQEFVSI
jgi:hypothetical protein